jgi:hypothetical protein
MSETCQWSLRTPRSSRSTPSLFRSSEEERNNFDAFRPDVPVTPPFRRPKQLPSQPSTSFHRTVHQSFSRLQTPKSRQTSVSVMASSVRANSSSVTPCLTQKSNPRRLRAMFFAPLEELSASALVTAPSEDGSETSRLALRSSRTLSLTRIIKISSPRSAFLVSRACYRARNGRQRTALPWGFFPYDVFRRKQRPMLGLPHPTMLRLQAFSTS